MLTQFIRFLVVGGTATAIQYLILIVLTEMGAVGPVTASAIGYIFSGAFNYAMNYWLTFESDECHGVAVVKFSVVAGGGLVLNSALMYFLVHGLTVNYLVAQVLATACVLVWHFFLHRSWTYQRMAKAR